MANWSDSETASNIHYDGLNYESIVVLGPLGIIRWP